ncbi:MAG TPA: hypothetical protein EYQ42_07080 [Thiotrichaceae bacterium]|jgi:hypothetical protein|nr:hypothetical protein [Thiotrichaceae bacterium]HIM06969.1 hypothetical protein [Gammaproteobacteria bacterium]
MNKKAVRIAIYVVSFFIFISASFVTADYFALFGTKLDVRLDFVELRFRTVNADTGSPVMEVGVRCFQKHNTNACTRRDSHRVGIVSVHIPVRQVIKKTILFEMEEEIIKTTDPKLNIMLLHQNYDNPTRTFLMDDIYANKIGEVTVKMPPIAWEDAEEEQEEVQYTNE